MGDPTIPRDILRAKMIREQMTDRADILDSCESDDVYADDFEATAPILPGSAFFNTVPSVINETEEEKPDASNL